MEAMKGKTACFYKSIYAKKDRNGPSSANQFASKDEPRRGHAVCTLQMHPPTPPVPPFLHAHAEPKFHHGSDIMKLKSHDGYIR